MSKKFEDLPQEYKDLVQKIKDARVETEKTRTKEVEAQNTETEFKEYCNIEFSPLLKELSKIALEYKKHLKAQEEHAAAQKKLYGKHIDGEYRYYWEKCENCHGNGSIRVGTGHYKHQGDSDSEGFYIESEVMEDRTCTKCSGSGGFIKYIKGGSVWEQQKPCSIYQFERNQDDFLKIILD